MRICKHRPQRNGGGLSLQNRKMTRGGVTRPKQHRTCAPDPSTDEIGNAITPSANNLPYLLATVTILEKLQKKLRALSPPGETKKRCDKQEQETNPPGWLPGKRYAP